MRVYRYDDEDFADGQILRSRGDHAAGLSEVERQVEAALRALGPRCETLRRESLYTWRDEAFALRIFPHCGKRYLYELEVGESNIRHVGDVDRYSAAKDAAKDGESFGAAVSAYWDAPAADATRVEVLVSEATVVRKR